MKKVKNFLVILPVIVIITIMGLITVVGCDTGTTTKANSVNIEVNA